jgi:hypothetical protein
MDLFALGRALHSTVGIVALVSFWLAALARKGGRLHRGAGQVYLVSMVLIMTLSSLMVAGKALAGDPTVAVYLAFLISMVGTASWLMCTSFQLRRSPERWPGGVYRTLATWLVVAGFAVFCLGASRGRPIILFLSLLGVGFGANMWRLALAEVRGPRWWLAHHVNGATLNFIATHDSFLALGVGSVLPELRQPAPRMMVAVGVTVVALSLRLWVVRHRTAGRSEVAGAGDGRPGANVSCG